jgi:hypothetical protein
MFSPILCKGKKHRSFYLYIITINGSEKKILPGKGDFQWLKTTLNLLPLKGQ